MTDVKSDFRERILSFSPFFLFYRGGGREGKKEEREYKHDLETPGDWEYITHWGEINPWLLQTWKQSTF